MRVGLNGWFFDQPGVGSGQYVRHLAAGLAKLPSSDLSHQIFCPDGGDVSVPLRHIGPLAKVWYEQVDLPRAARRRIDILHYPYFASPLVSPCPTIVTIHDLIPLLFPEYSANPLVKLYNALIVRAARQANAIIAVSEHTKKDIVAQLRIPAARVHVIYEAPDEAFHPQNAETIAAVKQRYGLDRYIFYIGGLNRHKNVPALLEAFARVRQDVPGLCLAIAGKAHAINPAVFPDLRPVAASLGLTWTEGAAAPAGNVRLLGYVAEEDKPALYAGAAAFVYPSLYEGFGFCPLEAMASGVPVISSRAASLAEIVGDGGIQVDPADIRGMAAAVVAVLGDEHLAQDLRTRGFRQAARFSWDRTVAETVAVYQSVHSL
jgi:glycosyltransferase involved in cell wall biosynthesis